MLLNTYVYLDMLHTDRHLHILTCMYMYVHIRANTHTYLFIYTYIYLHWLHCWERATASTASVSEVVLSYLKIILNIH